MSKQISIRISDEEYSQLGGGNVSGEIKRRCFNNNGGDMKAVMDRLDKLALLFMEMNKKLSKPEVKVPAVDYSKFYGVTVPDVISAEANPRLARPMEEIMDGKYSEIIKRLEDSFERELDYEERGSLSRDIKGMGLNYNQYKKTLEKLENGKFNIIKQF